MVNQLPAKIDSENLSTQEADKQYPATLEGTVNAAGLGVPQTRATFARSGLPPAHPLPPPQRCTFQLFSFPVELTVIESGGLFFLASPRGPETAGSFREDIASNPATPRQLLSAARASAPREPGERFSQPRPEG
ncbi:unnamed protein product [Rangifer tarandus platyrhynchus]|uniref:Uncharacterized protein n=1 Tax=Rangifer tarandus platyrhynchus TaxID=3082113 RepID=A0ABN8YF46_RANTA|nr:unnamed protein product [Rangifer tarandus platyrhynchus]